MDLVAERIGDGEPRDEMFGEGLDGANLHGEPRIVDQVREAARLGEETRRLLVQFADRREQRRRRFLLSQHLHRSAMRRERVLGQIDPVEVAVVLAAVLQVIDDLQRGAERVIRRPDPAGILAVNVADEAPDGHRRIAAIVDEIVPVPIAQLGHVALERRNQVARMLRIEAARAACVAQAARDRRIRFGLSDQRAVERVQEIELFLRAERGMIGNIVGGANEIIKGEDRRAMARRDQKGGDGKIFVAMGLSRTRPLDVHDDAVLPLHDAPAPSTSISRLASISSDDSNLGAAVCARGA